ncbi:MAG: exodeoxyribonuclease VII small subunit [Bacteroidia bacterium]|nr:exodeoxyribonuclease VII small subunit [Bacteroidia bacterium]
MMEKFDYAEALKELEKIALKVEDPSTGIDDIDKYIRQSDELIAKCREYLRTAREKLDTL